MGMGPKGNNSPKTKVASVFNQDEEDGGEKRLLVKPSVKSTTPVMDEVMKEELRERDKAFGMVDEATRKREINLQKIQDNKHLDLREILEGKKGEGEKKRSRERGNERKRSEERQPRTPERGRRKSPKQRRTSESKKTPRSGEKNKEERRISRRSRTPDNWRDKKSDRSAEKGGEKSVDRRVGSAEKRERSVEKREMSVEKKEELVDKKARSQE